MIFCLFKNSLILFILFSQFAIHAQAGIINLLIKKNEGFSTGPWTSSFETGDKDTQFRPKITVQYNFNGQDQTKIYVRPIGGQNPLVYIWNSQCDGTNYYETVTDAAENNYKLGDSFHIKFHRQTLIQCDISDIPKGAKINSVEFEAKVHGDGGSSDGIFGIMENTKIWEKDKITCFNFGNNMGKEITTLKVYSTWGSNPTFIKKKWWKWNWDSKLLKYVQGVLDLGQTDVSVKPLIGNNSNNIHFAPNPFYSHTRIALSQNGLVKRAHLFDIKGNLVKTFHLPPSLSGTFLWNGLDDKKNKLPGGTYFLKVRNNQDISTRPIVILK